MKKKWPKVPGNRWLSVLKPASAGGCDVTLGGPEARCGAHGDCHQYGEEFCHARGRVMRHWRRLAWRGVAAKTTSEARCRNLGCLRQSSKLGMALRPSALEMCSARKSRNLLSRRLAHLPIKPCPHGEPTPVRLISPKAPLNRLLLKQWRPEIKDAGGDSR